MKLEKDGVIKDIKSEKEAGDYIAAGWKKVENKPEGKKYYKADAE